MHTSPVLLLEDLVLTRPRVFGIGFHKTATTSLAHALYTLGYTVAGCFDTGVLDDDDHAIRRYALEVARLHTSTQDMPWPVLYKELDVAFPGSKFILSMRDEQAWWRSVESHFATYPIATHRWVYGVPTAAGHERTYRERYRRHNAEVRAYFADRPEDLLVTDFGDGEGWDALCAFLGIETPDFDFPRQNAAVRDPLGLRRGSERFRRELRRFARSRDGFGDVKVMWRRMQQHCERGDALYALLARIDGSGREIIADASVSFHWRHRSAMATLGVVELNDASSRSPEPVHWSQLVSTTRHYIGNLHDDTYRRRVGGQQVARLLEELHDDGLGILNHTVDRLGSVGIDLDPGRFIEVFPATVAGRPL